MTHVSCRLTAKNRISYISLAATVLDPFRTQLANELNGQVLRLGLKAQVLGLGKELETVLSPPKTGGKLVPPRTGKNNAASRQ